jgi:N,N'-diacetyllegionaminate synthase
MVDAAAGAGASAIDLQIGAESDPFADGHGTSALDDDGSSVHADGSSRSQLDAQACRALVAHARARGLAIVATPFSFRDVELLEALDVDGYKIRSGDLTYCRLIDYCARTRKPVILSTGMATAAEIRESVWFASRAGGHHTAILHCVSAHPVPRGSENLRAIATLASTFRLPIGLSDHSNLPAAVSIAIALGACLYERHLRLDDDESLNREASSTPGELAAIVRMAAETAAALGHGRKECLSAEENNLAASRRSLRAARRLPAGHVVKVDDIAVLRPGTGLPPEREADLIGVRLTRTIDDGGAFLACDLAAPETGTPEQQVVAAPLAISGTAS